VTPWTRARALAVYHDGVTVICELARQITGDDWNAPTPCTEWRVIELAAHLRCVADDYHEYLDDAPASRLARLMATGAPPETLARKLARQNAAELAALPDATGPEHIEAFAASARIYAQRLWSYWDLPHHRYRGTEVTVGGMAGGACTEWHLHAWDLVRAMRMDYRPADPDVLVAGWRAGLPHLALPAGEPWEALLVASGRSPDWRP
jgi:Mycothiol maleylpyruvate isomerase N-terminal domain